jgi:hypothetical protein
MHGINFVSEVFSLAVYDIFTKNYTASYTGKLECP